MNIPMIALPIVAVTVAATVADEIDGKTAVEITPDKERGIGIHHHDLEIAALEVHEGRKDVIDIITARLPAVQTAKNLLVLSSLARLHPKVVKTNLDVISDRLRSHPPYQYQAMTGRLRLQWFHLY